MDRKGFTLIETLVAIGVLGMTVSAIVGLLATSARTLTFQKNKLIATQIAIEGVEFLINKRDNNLQCLRNGSCSFLCGWTDRLLDTTVCPGVTAHWEVDAAKPGDLLPNVKFNDHNPTHYICIENTGTHIGKFTYCNNDARMLPQKFDREVRVSQICDGSGNCASDKIRVESIVTWQERLIGTQTIKLEEIIFGSDT